MKYILTSLGFFLLMSSCTKAGATWQHYRLSALDEARTRNMTIFLHFFEENNPACEKQKTELELLIQDKKFEGVGAYRVAWQTEKGLQKMFDVKTPCTLLIFKGSSIKSKISSDVGPELLRMALIQGL